MPDDYLAVHQWFDRSKRSFADFRHRALYHHTEGIFDCEAHFGPTITLSTCAVCGKPAGGYEHVDGALIQGPRPHTFNPKLIPTRWVGEQHVQEDLGFIPHAAQYLERIQAECWMNRSRKLSKELESEWTSSTQSSEASSGAKEPSVSTQ
jgi:hypothetical protein